MGKSYKKHSIISRSESVTEDKHRGFARVSDRNSHHSKRNNNRNADELTFQHGAVKRGHIYNLEPGKSSNVPNDHHVYWGRRDNREHLVKYEISFGGNYNNELNPEENIEKYFSENKIKGKEPRSFHFLRATQKQYQRRNDASRFCGYNEDRDIKQFEIQTC
jgi:hypothetical protein